MLPLAVPSAKLPFWSHPSRLMAAGLAGLVATGTALLWLPAATAGPGHAPLRTALFTATSAASLTGLGVVDTGTYWSPLGQVVIMALIQVGGLGVMTSASLVAVLIAGRMGLRSRLSAEYETRTMSLSTVRRVITGTALLSLVVEAVVAVVLTGRLWLGHGYPFGKAAWFAVFHAVTAFNNAGFSLWPDKLVGAATDPWILLPVAVALIVGGLGYPVVYEALRVRPVRRWSVHAKTTLAVTGVLLLVGPLALIVGEWPNPHTLGALDVPGRLLAGGFSGITPRTAGLNVIDYGQTGEATLLFTDILMFIGGGSGSTAGVIKVTTIAVLLMAVVAEARGDRDIDIFGRRMSPPTVRQAIAVATLGMVVVLGSALVLLEISDLPLDHVLFEVTSALCTVGLSTGITPHLPAAGQYLLVALMYFGRIGSVTVVTALALRSTSRAYRNPEGRPFIG